MLTKITNEAQPRGATLQLFYNCNYGCSYCYYGCNMHKGMVDLNSDEIRKMFITKTIKVLKFLNKKIFNYYLMGGEPALLKKELLIELITLILRFNKKNSLIIISNFSIDNNYYIEINKELKKLGLLKRFQWQFSYHDEFISFEKFYNKLKSFLITLEKNNLVSKVQYMTVITKENLQFKNERLEKLEELHKVYSRFHIRLPHDYFLKTLTTEIREKNKPYRYYYSDGTIEKRYIIPVIKKGLTKCKPKAIFFDYITDNVISSCSRMIFKNFFNISNKDIKKDFFEICNCKRRICVNTFDTIFFKEDK